MTQVSKMKVLVCGGAGYIGAHMVRWLGDAGHEVVVFDNLSTGHRAAVAGVPLIVGDLLDPAAIDRALTTSRAEVVMHFCAKALVGESVTDPYLYYDNNVVGTLNLLKAMRRSDVGRLVFSSTCAIFGVPQTPRIEEHHPKAPVNPYGASKLMCEQMLADAAGAYGLRSVALRYFNAAGASPAGGIGESHDPETHLIPNAIRAVLGIGPALNVLGRDYPTADGTCVRDYVHVDDLAQAHACAMDYLDRHEGAHVFNLGSENGASVLEVIESVERVTGRKVPRQDAPRRAGDPPSLVADSRRARDELGWAPRYQSLDSIVETAWRWHQAPGY
jgi:UDP-glucose 4-epimerase